MKILVGDEYGLVKCVDTEKKLLESKYGEIKKKNGILGINKLFETDKHIFSILNEHKFSILNWNTKEIKSQPIEDIPTLGFNSQIVKHTIDFSSAIVGRNDDKVSIIQYNEALDILSNNTYDLDTKRLQTLKNSHVTQEFFCLFKDSPVSIFNLEKEQIIWKGKNFPHDELDLRVPIWDVDIAHSKSNNNVFYTATAYGEIRTYDRKVKNRPVNDKKVYNRKINRLVMSSCENYLITGDTIGTIFMLDKRKNFTIAKSMKGSTGAIKDIYQIPNSSIVLTCGYDRFLRVFDYKTNEDLPQIYMKHKLNVICPYEVIMKKEESEDMSEDKDSVVMIEGESDDEIDGGEEDEGDEEMSN